MKNRKITKDDLVGYSATNCIMAESGKGKIKVLNVVTEVVGKRVWFEVLDRESEVYAGPDLDTAIELYYAI